MSRPALHDELLGELEFNPETGAWQAEWEFAPGHPVELLIHHEQAMDAVPGEVKRLLLTLKDKDPSVREEVARKLIRLCNEDWNPDEQLTEDEFAGRVKLQGVNVSAETARAELFYDDDDIFAGHSISVFMGSDGRLSEPNLAG